jgi:hypothetical protein
MQNCGYNLTSAIELSTKRRKYNLEMELYVEAANIFIFSHFDCFPILFFWFYKNYGNCEPNLPGMGMKLENDFLLQN